MIKTVIFDMDGVIQDSETISDKVWQMAADELKLGDCSKAINTCRGMNKADAAEELKNIYGKAFDGIKFWERTSQLFKEIEFSEGIPLMPYAKEALDYLSQKYTLILASSTRGEAVRRQMTNEGVIHYFKTLTTGDMVKHSKPDPEIYLMAAASVNMLPEECVAIEDSPNGVKSAVNAGIKCIMVPDRSAPDDLMKKIAWKIIPSLKEISSIL